MKLKSKVLAMLATVTVFSSVLATPVVAATETYANGDYTATVHMYKEADPTALSMCDPIFDHDAEVQLTDDATIITIYVAYPIPNYSTLGTEGTLLDVVATYNDVEYEAALDVTSLTERELDETSALFGTTAGESYPTEAITFTLPADAITTAVGDGIYLSAYVNSVMNSTQYFYMKLTDVAKVATESTTQESTLTAEVEANVPSYTVTVPATVALGTLSKEEDTVVPFEVSVEAVNFDGDAVEVVAVGNGTLTSGENTLAFINDFGSQKVTESATLTGNITVLADNVAAAKAGNYTGTTSFVINYYAAN